MNFDDAAGLLQETLDEEGEADKLLTRIAGKVNDDAFNEAEVVEEN